MARVTATQDFAQTAAAVFGDAIDVEGLWAEVAKMNPGPEGVHTPGVLVTRRRKRVAKRAQMTPEQRKARQDLERKVAQVSNAVGLAAGTVGTGAAVQAYRKTKASGDTGPLTGAVARRLKVSPRAAGRLGVLGAGGALALQTGNVAGDVVTARVLGQKPVEKAWKDFVGGFRKVNQAQVAAVMPKTSGPGLQGTAAQTQRWNAKAAQGTLKRQQQGVQRQTQGALRQVNQAPAVVERAGGDVSGRIGALRTKQANRQAAAAQAKPSPAQTWTERGQGAKADLNSFLGTTTGKITAGGAGAFAAANVLQRKRGEQAYDPYGGFGKADDSYEFFAPIAKFDDDKRLAFGWASIVKKNGLPVVDRQGDYIAIDDVEDAAYTYVEKSRVGGHMHKRALGKADGDDRPHHVADMVESMVFTPEKIAKMGLPTDFPTGWWVGYRVFDDDVWEAAKSGKLTGFSIHGKGIRKSVDYDEVMSG